MGLKDLQGLGLETAIGAVIAYYFLFLREDGFQVHSPLEYSKRMAAQKKFMHETGLDIPLHEFYKRCIVKAEDT